jgi:hypothetical protein
VLVILNILLITMYDLRAQSVNQLSCRGEEN